MTSDISVCGITVKPSAVKWRCSLTDYTDTCTIELPLSLYTKKNGDKTIGEPSYNKLPFHEGGDVLVMLGYDKRNTTRFMGKILRINYAVPLQIECEGYSYDLRGKRFTKSYQKTTAYQLLKDLCADTDIIIQKKNIADLPLTNVWFKDFPALEVLDWLKKNCACRIWFDFDKLFLSPSMYSNKKDTVKLIPGFNTVKDDELKKSAADGEVRINIVSKDTTGKTKKTKSDKKQTSAQKSKTEKQLKVRSGLPSDYLKQVASSLDLEENHQGYEGSITCFLEPSFEKSMTVNIDDQKFPDRSGHYFVETVEGEFSASGGRQKLTLKHYDNN